MYRWPYANGQIFKRFSLNLPMLVHFNNKLSIIVFLRPSGVVAITLVVGWTHRPVHLGLLWGPSNKRHCVLSVRLTRPKGDKTIKFNVVFHMASKYNHPRYFKVNRSKVNVTGPAANITYTLYSIRTIAGAIMKIWVSYNEWGIV